MSNEEQNLHTIKKSQSHHKTHNLPDLQIKIGNNTMKFSDYNSNEKYQMAHKILSTNYQKTFFLKNDEMNTNKEKLSKEKKFNSEDCYISTDVENSPKRLKKSNLKGNSNIPNHNNEHKKSVKFAGNSNNEPLETVIYIHQEYNDENEENENNNINNNNKNIDKENCKCDCSIF